MADQETVVVSRGATWVVRDLKGERMRTLEPSDQVIAKMRDKTSATFKAEFVDDRWNILDL